MRHALRVISREKAFATFAILTLALGIGAVTTIFSIVDSVLLKPLAYKDPGRLYAASESAPKHTDIFKPMGFNWAKLGRLGQFNFACLIRLRPGAKPARAEAEMTAAIADVGRDVGALTTKRA